MGFRPDLDLTSITKHYEVFGGESTAGINYVKADDNYEGEQSLEPIPDRLYPTRTDDPLLIQAGPVWASTSMSLALDPEWCWDVNRYYEVLGVRWNATRKELRIGYLAAGGQQSVYLTYVFKQLLTKRREYDRSPLGEPFLDDEYVQEEIKRRAAAEAKRRSARGDYTTARNVVEEEYNFIPEEEDGDTSVEPLDREAATQNASSTPTVEWLFSYYVWRSSEWNTDRLATWQNLLIAALAARGEHLQLTVGYLGRQPHRFVVGHADNRYVVFINEAETPTTEMAEAAATSLISEIDSNRLPSRKTA